MFYYEYPNYPDLPIPEVEGGGNMLADLITGVNEVVTGFIGTIMNVFTTISTEIISNPLFIIAMSFTVIGIGLGLLFRFLRKARA